ncbi:ribosomal large subunit pseudouridine synthase A [Atlantibacter hermannii]|nr:ribosomal large subunit pseudouridine synthase A [Atlantibacter hermannii]
MLEAYHPSTDPWLVVLYQDDHIMVVNKPSGLLSVPGRLEEHKDSVMTRIQRDYRARNRCIVLIWLPAA